MGSSFSQHSAQIHYLQPSITLFIVLLLSSPFTCLTQRGHHHNHTPSYEAGNPCLSACLTSLSLDIAGSLPRSMVCACIISHCHFYRSPRCLHQANSSFSCHSLTYHFPNARWNSTYYPLRLLFISSPHYLYTVSYSFCSPACTH